MLELKIEGRCLNERERLFEYKMLHKTKEKYSMRKYAAVQNIYSYKPSPLLLWWIMQLYPVFVKKPREMQAFHHQTFYTVFWAHSMVLCGQLFRTVHIHNVSWELSLHIPNGKKYKNAWMVVYRTVLVKPNMITEQRITIQPVILVRFSGSGKLFTPINASENLVHLIRCMGFSAPGRLGASY